MAARNAISTQGFAAGFDLDLETERSRFATWSALDRYKDWERFVSWLGSTNTPVCNPSFVEGTDNRL